MDDLVIKILQTLGVPGLTIWLIYKLLDRYVGQFLGHMTKFVEVNAQQAAAVTAIVASVQEAQSLQKDVGMALRAMSAQLGELIGRVKELEAQGSGKGYKS
jgi:hypothetical protein